MTREDRAAQRRGRTSGRRRAAAPASASRKPLTERGRTTRARLLTAARAVFSHAGYSEVRITDITEEAGVAGGTFYTYFDSKEEIFHEVASQVLAEMADAPRHGPESVSDPARQVEIATRRYFECILANARIARSIEEVQVRERDVAQARRGALISGVKRIERWIGKLQEQGICDPDVEPWPTALALHAMNVSVAYDHLVHRDSSGDMEELLRATMRIWRVTLGLDRRPRARRRDRSA